MNITFITNTFSYGGAEKMLNFVAEGLFHRGYNISVINLNTIKQQVRVPAPFIKYKVLESSEYNGMFKTNLEWVNFTKKCAKEFKSDVLIGFLSPGCFSATVAGKLLGIPSIVCERNDPSVYSSAPLSVQLKMFIINCANGAVFQTIGASQCYSKRLRAKSEVIPNPIFINSPIPPFDYTNSPHTVVTMGRLENRQKAVDVMIHTFAKFHESHQDYKLIVYGTGDDRELMEKIIEEKGIVEFVDFKGLSNNSLSDLAKEGIFLITSNFEGISNSLLEAMAIGMPVVSTDHSPGGARMLITDHENGILAPVGDSDALAKALSEYADNADLAKKCGMEATKVLTRFQPDKILDMWETYINRVVKKYINL